MGSIDWYDSPSVSGGKRYAYLWIIASDWQTFHIRILHTFILGEYGGEEHANGMTLDS